MTPRKFPMKADRMIGDAGNLTVYERPDQSRYALDKKGHGQECDPETPIFGRARFDARELASGIWKGSRSERQVIVVPDAAISSQRRVRHAASTRR
ncbi:MAG: hypothetical protein M3383_05785 [Actinomycetota bacterium]|nr:hypothetical protein [Actinomycetota bacterium]